MKNVVKAVLTVSCWFAACSVANAQSAMPSGDPAHLSLVAGYKAAFTCSAHFNAGRSVDDIAGDELHRIYPGYREAMAKMPDAMIDEEAKRVSVSYAQDFPPRMAQWRPLLGCVQLPTGADDAAVDDLQNITIKQSRVVISLLSEAFSGDAGLLV